MFRRLFRRASSSSSSSGLSQFGGVHGSFSGSGGNKMMMRNKPLIRINGDKFFRTGAEAASLLIEHGRVIDKGNSEFLSSCENVIQSLGEQMTVYSML